MKADVVSSSTTLARSPSKDSEQDMMDVDREDQQDEHREDEKSSMLGEQREPESSSRDDDGQDNNEQRDGAKKSVTSRAPASRKQHRKSSSSPPQGGGRNPYPHDPYRSYGYPPQNMGRNGHSSYPPPPPPPPPYGYAPAPGSAPSHWDRGMGPPPPHHYPALPHPGQGPPPPHYGSYHHPYHMSGRPGYGPPSYPPPPPHGYMQPYHGVPPPGPYPMNQKSMASSDASIGSLKSKGNKSKNSKSKKRTIEGLDNDLPFRRTASNSSSNTSVTHGNNTSTETPYLMDDSPQKSSCSANLFEDENELNKQNMHTRDDSLASTASLSVEGFSMSYYDRVNAKNPMAKASPKRRKGQDAAPSEIDINHRRVGSTSSHSTRFQQLSMEEGESSEKDNRNLFLSLSTSPINSDVEATPNIKNTKRNERLPVSVPRNPFHSFDQDTPTPTPTNDHDMMIDGQTLNQHLRSQTFTPLSHLNSEGRDNHSASPSNHAFQAIAPQLSWSIAGDAPSLADLASWDEHDDLPKSGEKRLESRLNVERLTVLSPNSDIDGSNVGLVHSGTTTPLPLFYRTDSMDERESSKRSSGDKAKAFHFGEPLSRSEPHHGEPEHIHRLFVTNGGRGSNTNSSSNSSGRIFRQNSDYSARKTEHPPHMRMPPTPVFSAGEYRDDYDRGGSTGFFQNSNYFSHPGGGRGERVRNLRGHVPPSGGPPPMHMHMPPPISHHNLTSPMGISSNGGKITSMWGTPLQASPHPSSHHSHIGMSSSKHKCVALKAPIPSKFQGDMEKTKDALMPEFTSLVNFPAHMSQKQTTNLPDGMRCCVMCGQACPCSAGGKSKKHQCANKAGAAKASSSNSNDGGLANRNANSSVAQKDNKQQQQQQAAAPASNFAIIPTQNKGLCTLCDVNVWVVTQSGLEIKWCKGCKNFRPWAAFGEKGLATKCLRCRERQREKYALQKEEKEKTRSTANKNATKAKVKA